MLASVEGRARTSAAAVTLLFLSACAGGGSPGQMPGTGGSGAGTGGVASGGTNAGGSVSAGGTVATGGRTGTGAGGTMSGAGGAGAGSGGSATTGAGGTKPTGTAGAGMTGSGGTGAGGAMVTPPAIAQVPNPGPTPVSNAGITVNVDASGAYSVTFKSPAFTFSGNLGAAASGVATKTGSDTLGPYSETTFSYSSGGTRNGRIRAYTQVPVVVFGETNPAAAANTRNFPKFTKVPSLPYHVSYGAGPWADYTLKSFNADSPWTYFDSQANTFIISGASHFTNIQTAQASGGITVGISSQISSLPAGFEQTAIVAADVGINRTFTDWGWALINMGGKKQTASDGTPELAKFGYWTDNGGAYHYATAPGMNYEQTLASVKSDFETTGKIPLAYMQLDSWWYPKGPTQSWSDSNSGESTFTAAPALFPEGLAGFQQKMGFPFLVHARWIDTSSPYRQMYKMSGNEPIDPAFWTMIASYLKSASVITYEQDWLSDGAEPATNNLTDQDAFLDNMASAMGAAGIDIQYCMPWARHFLQSTKYNNVTTIRPSDDRFDRNRWRIFFWGSRLSAAVGLWPWSDVFKSSEHDNLLLSTLAAGIMGSADAINTPDFASIRRAIRSDGMLIKPDTPFELLDKSFIAEAAGTSGVGIGSTYSMHPAGKVSYVFAFTDTAGATASFMPSELGYGGNVYVYNVNAGTGQVAMPSTQISATLATTTTTAYYVVTPIGASGIGFLGEQGKIAPLGTKRIASFSDDGTVAANVVFASGEGAITLQGYAPSAPTVTASTGSVGAVSYSSTTHLFTVPVTAAGTTATVHISP